MKDEQQQKRGRGRPKGTDPVKGAHVGVRLTRQERDEVAAHAAAVGEPLSGYLRKAALLRARAGGA